MQWTIREHRPSLRWSAARLSADDKRERGPGGICANRLSRDEVERRFDRMCATVAVTNLPTSKETSDFRSVWHRGSTPGHQAAHCVPGRSVGVGGSELGRAVRRLHRAEGDHLFQQPRDDDAYWPTGLPTWRWYSARNRILSKEHLALAQASQTIQSYGFGDALIDQKALVEALSRFLGHAGSKLLERVVAGTLRFRLLRGRPSHEKLYLLVRSGRSPRADRFRQSRPCRVRRSAARGTCCVRRRASLAVVRRLLPARLEGQCAGRARRADRIAPRR